MPPAKKPPAKPATPPKAAPPKTMADVIHELRRPFTAAALKWKIQTNPKAANKPAIVVAFIDSRLATERLNAVIPGGWSCTYMPAATPQGLVARMKIRLGDEEVIREDAGIFPPGSDANITLKGGYSDALKRVAVQFGVGVSVYALPIQYIDASKGLDSWTGRDGKTRYSLSARALAYLELQYQAWLENVGIQYFGQPLDHGDVRDSAGDVETEGVQPREEVADGPPPADPEPPAAAPAPAAEGGDTPPPAAEPDGLAEKKRIHEALQEAGIQAAYVRNQLTAIFGVSKISEVPDDRLAELAKWAVDTIKATTAQASS